ncbi:hypothetical protein PR048_002363 [Dryococelus australis]|uniref:Uncharacterized protein n=1 Tax=Dryococelus australis TaxID=614101 RepID=A0ABQ9IK01_9NEOP|nr:hypothetical protein PR048_002363 [Dryococelus australis]
MQWYADNNVRRSDWPGQSPDLNPIEHLCSTNGMVAKGMATNTRGCPANTRREHARLGGCCYSRDRWPYEILTGLLCAPQVLPTAAGIRDVPAVYKPLQKHSTRIGQRASESTETNVFSTAFLLQLAAPRSIRHIHKLGATSNEYLICVTIKAQQVQLSVFCGQARRDILNVTRINERDKARRMRGVPWNTRYHASARLTVASRVIVAFVWSDSGKPWKTELKMTEPGIEPRSSRMDAISAPMRRVISQTTAPKRRDLICTVQRHDRNTAHLARRSDETLGVRVSVDRIAFSLLDLGREPGSIPSYIASRNRAGRCRWSAGFLGDLPFFPRPCIPVPLKADLASPSSALRTSLLGAVLISPPTTAASHTIGCSRKRLFHGCDKKQSGGAEAEHSKEIALERNCAGKKVNESKSGNNCGIVLLRPFHLPVTCGRYRLLFPPTCSTFAVLTNSCDNRAEHPPRRRHRGSSPRPSDYKSATLPLSYEGQPSSRQPTTQTFLPSAKPSLLTDIRPTNIHSPITKQKLNLAIPSST